MGHGEVELGSKLHLFGFSPNFTIGLSSRDMPETTRSNGEKDVPTAFGNRYMAARLPPGYERCWCRGYGNGCGLIRSLRTRQYHAKKERMLEVSKYDKIRRDIRAQWLTVQSPENRMHPPANSIGNFVG